MTTTCEAVYCFDRATVRFAMYPEGLEGPRVLAEISEDALRDVFGARDGPDSLLEACEANFDAIEKVAAQRRRRRPEAPIELEIMDFSAPPGAAPAEPGAQARNAQRP
ncbi:hypothetical protein QTI33_26395 [Variovorax sp. J22P271]|uniref:hypothetical protein n=1 Tax=Variovorax davisae TaxID=3053515 RepID=UPI00257730F1|nr:hypothetical protein [Variovorax sp. J22P271]MDM0035691.1 hypothetical protein [Variovorax sp. J22P271]